jgi:hypothetical protein
VTGLSNIAPYVSTDVAQAGNIAISGDVAQAARQVEEVFLNELLKVMLQSTELAKEKVVSDFLPVFTMEISKEITKRGIGLQEFLLNSPSFANSVGRGVRKKGTAGSSLPQDSGKGDQNLHRGIRAYEEVLE